MTNDELIDVLRANRFMRSRDEVLAFDEALAALAEQPEERLLPSLFLIFDNACEHHEVMWGLLHYVESFDLEVVVRVFAGVMSILLEHASEWVDIFLHRFLNSPETRAHLKHVIPSLPPENQESIRRELKKIAQSSKHFRSKVDEVIS